MNQREYTIISEVIREAKENELEALKFGYTEDDIRPALLTIGHLQHNFAYRLKNEYSNFDEAKFMKACEV